jgi:hypothetical protein
MGIEELSRVKGNLHNGRIYCDNEDCGRTLFEWSIEQNAPSSDRDGFYAYSIKSRVLFGPHPTQLAINALGVDFVFPSPSAFDGYILDNEVLPLKLDFCSRDCRQAWLANKKNVAQSVSGGFLKDKRYNVLLFGEIPQAEKQLMDEEPSRFTSFFVGNFLSETAPRNDCVLYPGELIKIAGKKYQTIQSSIRRAEYDDPPVGIKMRSYFMQCPHPVVTGSTCKQLFQILLDILPSAWICPKCGGMIIISDARKITDHSRADFRKKLDFGFAKINIDCFPSPIDWGNKQFNDWLLKKVRVRVIEMANSYYEGSAPPGMVMPFLVDAPNIFSLFTTTIEILT